MSLLAFTSLRLFISPFRAEDFKSFCLFFEGPNPFKTSNSNQDSCSPIPPLDTSLSFEWHLTSKVPWRGDPCYAIRYGISHLVFFLSVPAMCQSEDLNIPALSSDLNP